MGTIFRVWNFLPSGILFLTGRLPHPYIYQRSAACADVLAYRIAE